MFTDLKDGVLKAASKSQLPVIGRTDKVDLPAFKLVNVPAKIDTGAYGSSIHCRDVKVVERGDDREITFRIPSDRPGPGRIFHSSNFTRKRVRSSSGHTEERYIITTAIVLFGQEIETSFSLADRSVMKYPLLLGRRVLQRRFVVDVSRTNLSYKAKMKS